MAESLSQVTWYLLYDPNGKGQCIVQLGGGSSTPASARFYRTEERAISMRDRYFPGTEILPVTFDLNYYSAE